MSAQLALFADMPAQAKPEPTAAGLVQRVRQLMGARFKNFAWWCDGGNREMCAAVLWRQFGFTRPDAEAAVRAIASGAA